MLEVEYSCFVSFLRPPMEQGGHDGGILYGCHALMHCTRHILYTDPLVKRLLIRRLETACFKYLFWMEEFFPTTRENAWIMIHDFHARRKGLAGIGLLMKVVLQKHVCVYAGGFQNSSTRLARYCSIPVPGWFLRY